MGDQIFCDMPLDISKILNNYKEAILLLIIAIIILVLCS